MTNIIRWDPFREMTSLRRAMDRMFDDALIGTTNDWQPVTWDLALDVIENDEALVVKASVPGVKPEDLDITYNNNILTIKGQVKEDKEVKENRYHLRERRFGSFARSFTLPSTIKSDAIEASYEAGLLTLTMPKAEEAKPKRIEVTAGNHKLIEGSMSKN